MEQQLGEVSAVDSPPANIGRMLWLKRLIFALARPLTRRQAAFNQRIVAALREVGNRSLIIDRQLEETIKTKEARLVAIMKQLKDIEGALTVANERLSGMRDEFSTVLSNSLAKLQHLRAAEEASNLSRLDARLLEMEKNLRAFADGVLQTTQGTVSRAFEGFSAAVRGQLTDQVHSQFGILLGQVHREYEEHRRDMAEQVASARTQVSDQVHAQFGALLTQLIALSTEQRSVIFEQFTAARGQVSDQVHTQFGSLLGEVSKAFESFGVALRIQISDQVHTQFGKLPETIVEACRQRLDDALETVETSNSTRAEMLARHLTDVIHEQQGMLDRRLAALLAEEAVAVRRIVERLHPGADVGSIAPASEAQQIVEDLGYYHFELRHRGDPATIRSRQVGYVQVLAGRLGGSLVGKRVLDIGAGSGIFAEVLRDAGADAEGIDLNRVAVEAGQALGRPVRNGDLVVELGSKPSASLAAITSFQVVEHLPEAILRRMLNEAARVLQPGGLLLLETLNPRSLSAYRWYFMDLSHRHFLQPETLQHLAEQAGFVDVEVAEISMPPDYERLREGTADPVAAYNFNKLNAFIYGPMEYYLLARKPL